MSKEIEIRQATAADGAPIGALWHAAFEADDLPGFDEAEIDLFVDRLAADSTGAFVALSADQVAGFLHEQSHTVVVGPACRRRGIGRALVAHAERVFADHGETLLLWLPEGRPEAAAFLSGIGYAYRTSLWLMTLPAGADVPAPQFPDLVEVQRVDDVPVPAYVTLINAAFRDHVPPIQVTEEVIAWAHARPGFDPTTIVVLADCATGKPVGMGKVSPGEGTGEVDLIGLLPAWRGRALGRELLRWGVTTLRERGAGDVTLRVEAGNPTALRLYERTGFTRTREWRRHARALE